MKVIQDTPLMNLADDKLGRENIVDLILDSINNHVQNDHPCLVYGIYGKWGEGKTSLMNFIKSRLLEQGRKDNLNIVEFNPWLVDNQESLLKEFFNKTTSDLDRKTRKLFKRYCSAAILASKTILNTYTPGLGAKLAEFLELAKNALLDSEESLADLKKKTCEALKSSHKHLLVIIDDVDRLDKEELHAVLRLVRQVADFDNCIYLLAMDIDIVSKSIGEYYGMGGPQDGRKFIDKIVQVPITLPYISENQIVQIVQDELNVILDGYVSAQDAYEIATMVFPFFISCRDVKRYCNQLQFVLPHVKDEVNISDLCVLEAIKMANGECYNKIYECRKQLLREVRDVEYMKDDARKQIEEQCQKAKYEVVKSVEGVMKEIILNAIDILFAKRVLTDEKYIKEKRLNTSTYFAKYFVQKVPFDSIPDKTLNRLMQDLLSKSVHDIVDIIEDWASAYSIQEVKRVIRYVISHSDNNIEKCKVASLFAKSLSISSLSEYIPSHAVKGGDSIAMFVSIGILRRNRSYNDLDEAKSFDMYEDALSFIFAEADINYAMGIFYDLNEEIVDSKDVLNAVIPLLIDRFKVLPIKQQFEYSGTLLIPLFYAWRKHDSKSWEEYAEKLFDSPDTSCVTVLEKFVKGLRDYEGVGVFINFFGSYVEAFNKKLELEEKTAKQIDIVRCYNANYPQLLKEKEGL